jgi:ribonuclease Z
MHIELRNRLGITSCTAVPVDHCQHSFAIVIDGTPFGQVVYSGDCRPSNRLIQVAKGADLLIHEATFEDGMESEATLKRHSTIGEAIKVAEQMDAKFLLLTHFSQRYPKIPPLPMLDMESSSSTLSRLPIAFAFDYMRVSPGNLLLASKIIDSLRKLYKDEITANTMESEEDQFLSKIEVTEEGLSANDFFDTPGAFISMNCLH